MIFNRLDAVILSKMNKGIITDNLRMNSEGLNRLEKEYANWMFHTRSKIFYRSLLVTVDETINDDIILVCGKMA